MNSIERVTATIKGRPADRRAISLILPIYGARLTGCKLKKYYTDPAAYAHGQSAVRDKFKPDILLGPLALPLEGVAFGSQIRFFEDHAPNLFCPAITSANDLGALSIPDVDSNPQLLYFRETIRLMSAEHGTEVPIAAIVCGPVDLGAMIMGIEGWLDTLLFDETGTQRLLKLMIPFFVHLTNALLSDGAMFAVLPVDFTNPSIVTRKIAEEVAVPAMREAFSQLDGPVFIHSGGSPLAPFLELFADLPNVAGFVLNGGDSFLEARQKVKPEAVLVGNIEGPSLFMRKREEIMADCMTVLQDRRDDPYFILGTSMADIDYHTPTENIHVFREATETFAKGDAE